MEESRRSFIKKSSLIAIAGIGSQLLPDNFLFANTPGEVFTLPQLPYSYDALEPNIDKMTMEIHHTKHHQAYVDNLNKAMKEKNITGSLEDLMKNMTNNPPAVRNNGGGHWNHSFFWKIMKPNGGGNPTGKIAQAISSTFVPSKILKQLEEAA